MCGIAGVVSSLPLTERERTLLLQMNQGLVHRGPDADGVFFDTHVGLAMRRLSIIDLAGGHQPVWNETRTLVAVCNGEIYNYQDLRAELLGAGHRLQSRGDVETLVHLYEDQESRFLTHLRGMFALALWDRPQGRLLLARDRMGEKPLYYCRDRDGRLWFASELKSLFLVVPQAQRRLSPAAMNLFLTYQYVPEPATMYEGIWKLPAGHALTLSPTCLNADPVPYWEYVAIEGEAPTGDPVRLVRAELERACELMGTADVPVGIALSGGIDSSAVAALTARRYPGSLHAFSVGYPGRPSNDERRLAEDFANYLGIPFHQVELKTEELVAGFPGLVRAMDDPVGDVAAYGYFAVAKLARDHGVPVLLSGLGGDELFWGYEWVRECVRRAERTRRWRKLFDWRRHMFGAGAPIRLPFFDIHDELVKGDCWSRAVMPQAIRDTLAGDLWKHFFEVDTWDQLPSRLSHVLNQTWLLSNCLVLADRLSMAHSIEMRLPLLDVGVVELVMRLRGAGLSDWEKPHKWLLVEAVKDLIPSEILARPKQGFSPPAQSWYHTVIHTFGPLLSGGCLMEMGLLEAETFQRAWGGFSVFFQYKLVLLELWCRVNFVGERIEDIEAMSHAH